MHNTEVDLFVDTVAETMLALWHHMPVQDDTSL